MRYLALVLFAFTCLAQSPADSIRKVLADQVAAWNRGDIDTFMLGYDNSPKTAFIGKTVQHGWEEVRRNYHERYPTPEAMGKLDFSGLEVTLLGPDYANVVGKFHLARTAQGGGDASGVFTLLFHRTPAGWRIIQDHTS
jgi:ketosteroid isomerase-like protein